MEVYETGDGVIHVFGEDMTVNCDEVYLQYTGQSEYSIDEILLQINDNIVNGAALITGLFGMILGFIAAKELLRIWLQ